MSAPGFKDLGALWREKARRLHNENYFSEYPPARLAEVLRKGYVGLWRPDDALRIAIGQVERGHHYPNPAFIDDMRDRFGIVGTEVREALLRILDEIASSSYMPPRNLHDPPGYPFIFESRVAGGQIYFKIQIEGSLKRPRVRVCSCHPPLY